MINGVPYALRTRYHRGSFDVYDHLFVLDLFSRYILFLPLGYYFDRMRMVAEDGLAKRSLNKEILDRLGVYRGRRGAGAGLTPFPCMDLSVKITNHLVRSCEDDPVARRFAHAHRVMGRGTSRKKPLELSPQTRKIFKDDRNSIAHAQTQLSHGDKLKLCSQWDEHLQSWSETILLRDLDLTAQCTNGQTVSLCDADPLPGDGQSLELDPRSLRFRYNWTERGEVERTADFSAYPFLRCTVVDEEVRVQFLNSYGEDSDGKGQLAYTELCPVDDPTEGRSRGLVYVDDNIAFPWVRFACERRVVQGRIHVDRKTRVSLLFKNLGCDAARLEGFAERLPEGITTPEGEPQVDIDQIDLDPGQEHVVEYEIVGREATKSKRSFPCRFVSVEQATLRSSVPVDRNNEIQFSAAVSPRVLATRSLLRWQDDRWVPMSGPDNTVRVGEEFRVRVEFENPGPAIDSFQYNEDPGQGNLLVTRATVTEGDTQHEPLVTTAAGQPHRVGFHVKPAFASSGVVTLEYDVLALSSTDADFRVVTFSALQAGRVVSDNEYPDQVSVKVLPRADGKPSDVHLNYAAADQSDAGSSGECLTLEASFKSNFRSVMRDPVLSIVEGKKRVHEIHRQALSEPIRYGQEVNTRVSVDLPFDASPNLTLRLEYLDNRSRRKRLEIGKWPGGLWAVKDPQKLDRFYGREKEKGDFLDFLKRVDSPRPVFLQGESGSGKHKFVDSLEEISGSDPELCLQSMAPARVTDKNVPKSSQMLDILHSFLRQVEVDVGPDAADDAIMAARLDRLGAASGDNGGFLRGFLHHSRESVELLESNDSFFDEDLCRFFTALHTYQCQRSTAVTGHAETVVTVFPINKAADLRSDTAKILARILDRAMNQSQRICFLLVDVSLPNELANLVYPVKLDGWSLPEFRSVCDDVFVYPRLSEALVAALYDRVGSNPSLSLHWLKEIQKLQQDFTMESGRLTLDLDCVDNRILTDLRKPLLADLDDFLRRENLVTSRDVVCKAIAYLNCINGEMKCTDAERIFKKLMGLRLAQDLPGDMLQRVAGAGWAEQRGSFLAPVRSSFKRDYSKSLVDDIQPLFEAVFEHLYEQDKPSSASYLPRCGREVIARYRDEYLHRALTELMENEHPGIAQTYLVPLLTLPSDDSVAFRAAVLLGSAVAAIRLGEAESALHHLKQLDATVSDAGFKGYGAIDRANVKRWRAWYRAEMDRRDNRPPGAIARYFRSCLLHRRRFNSFLNQSRKQRLRFLQHHLEHQMLWLQVCHTHQEFRDLLDLWKALVGDFDDLSEPCKLAILDCVTRLCQLEERMVPGRRQRKRSRDDRDLRSSVEQTFGPESIADLVSRVSEEGLDSKVWQGRYYLRSVSSRLLVSSASRSNARELHDDIDKAVKRFKDAGAKNLLAEALFHRGLLHLMYPLVGVTDRLHQAYESISQAIGTNRSAGLEYEAAMMTRRGLAEFLKLDAVPDAILEQLLADLDRAYFCRSLPEKYRAEMNAFRVHLSSRLGKHNNVLLYLDQGKVDTMASGIVYTVRKQEALNYLASGDSEGAIAARETAAECRRILKEDLQATDSLPLWLLTHQIKPQFEALGLALIELRAARRLRGLTEALTSASTVLQAIGQLDCTDGELPDGIKGQVAPHLEATSLEGVVMAVLEICGQVWAELESGQRPMLDDRFFFFRSSILEEAFNETMKQQAWSMVRQAIPASVRESEEVKLFEAEVWLNTGAPLPEDLVAECRACAGLELEDDTVSLSVLKRLRVLCHWMLRKNELEEDHGWVIERLSQLLAEPALQKAAVTETIFLLREANELISTAGEHRGYLEGFIAAAVKALQAVELEDPSFDSVSELVKVCRYFSDLREVVVQWLSVWGEAALQERRMTEIRESFSVLAMEYGSVESSSIMNRIRAFLDHDDDRQIKKAMEASGGTVKVELPEDEAGSSYTAACLDFFRRLVDECSSDATGFDMDDRRGIIYDIVEKILEGRNPDLCFTTGLYFQLTSAEVDFTSLSLVGQSLNTMKLIHDPAAMRLRLCLAAGSLMLYWENGPGVHTSPSSTRNIIIDCRRIHIEVSNIFQRESVQRPQGQSEVSDQEWLALARLDAWTGYYCRLLAWKVVTELMPTWGPVARYSLSQTICVESLHELMVKDRIKSTATSLHKMCEDLHMVAKKYDEESWRHQAEVEVAALRPEVATDEWVDNRSQAFSYGAALGGVAFRAIDRWTDVVSDLSYEELLDEIRIRLDGHTVGRLPFLENVSFDEFMKDFHETTGRFP